MSRLSGDEYVCGRLMNGYDYDRQAWVIDGRYQDCGHPKPDAIVPMTGRPMGVCGCYGRAHAGERTEAKARRV